MSTPRPSICVFCGSRTGTKEVYSTVAQGLGAGLARAGFGLVYGAGDMGLMGLAAQAARAAGGHVTGFIPRHLWDREHNACDAGPLIVTETMHERKMLMFGNSQAIVTLPGGPGTLDELVEVMTWRQLGLHDRSIVLVNPEGYWDPFMRLLDHIIHQGFCDADFRDYATLVETADEAVKLLSEAFPART